MTADHLHRVVSAVAANSYRFANEDDLQRGIARALANAEIAFEREVVLRRSDRIDFLCGPIGIEVKVDGSISALTRQLMRYAESDRVRAIVLVTSRSRLGVQLPLSMNGKIVSVVNVGGFA